MAFPYHGSGSLIVVLLRNGTGSQRVTFWDDGTTGCATDFKVPLPMFSGRNDDWPVWSARFGAYVELAGWTGVLEVAEAQTAPISVVGASPEAIRLGKSLVHHTPRRDGAEAWRLLRAEYAGSSGARMGNMVREVVCHGWSW